MRLLRWLRLVARRRVSGVLALASAWCVGGGSWLAGWLGLRGSPEGLEISQHVLNARIH